MTTGGRKLLKRKLIEVSLPLEVINRESAHEKSVPRKGHPATLHLWWARRPVAAARAMLFAQVVDDPSSNPDEFLTEDLQRIERERLHSIIERLARWENTQDAKLMAEARAEILKSTGGSPPSILDPFAGGGTIPLEAQRLGLEVLASDLNPVSVLINKALIEIPQKFRGQPPILPGLADTRSGWTGAEGLAADVRANGEWMRAEAMKRLGRLYPTATLQDGTRATVVAWLWARTVTCPNPACQIEMPLVRSWWLGKKKGRVTYIEPSIVKDSAHPSGRRVKFDIRQTNSASEGPSTDGTMSRGHATCLACHGQVPNAYIRAEACRVGLGQVLMATVAEGKRQRLYLPPSAEHQLAARVDRPTDVPDQMVPSPNHDVDRLPMYGMPRWSDAFTNRQLLTLKTFSDLVGDVRKRILEQGGSTDYADANATYAAFLGSKLADWCSSLCSWIPQIEGVRDTFARQAIPMVWDFVEINPFSNSVGNVSAHFEWIAAALEAAPAVAGVARAEQEDAARRSYSGEVIATDPPYYDNVGYSDLSDYFYVWLRRSLREIYPELMTTLLVPKSAELVASPNRHGGKQGAERFFEDGFRDVFARARRGVSGDFPVTVYYAFKQSEASEHGDASTGWEKLLEGMIQSGWEITSTWPLRTERSGRMLSVGTNALASSIVLSLRPRPEGAATTDRRGFISTLEAELPSALRRLEQGQVAPVDLPQAAIGPGMAVFSRFAGVLEPDGGRMTVRSALARINEILDQVLNEQEGDFDTTTRFAIAWYRQHGYAVGQFGDADNLARARNTSVDVLDRDGILTSRAGHVQLIRPTDLAWDYDVATDRHTSAWEALHHLIRVLERDGIAPAGDYLQAALARPDGAVDADLVKELAHLLFRIAEGNAATKDALSFNSLVTSWPEILDAARTPAVLMRPQEAFDFHGED